MLWSTGPACTEVETLVLDWLAELLGLPERFRSSGPGGGVIQDGGLGRQPLRPARRPRAGRRAAAARRPRRLHLGGGPLVDREGRPRRRPRGPTSSGSCRSTRPPGRCGPDALALDGRRGRGGRAACRSSCAPPSAPRRPTRIDPVERDRGASPSPPVRGCTSTPPTPGAAAVCPELRSIHDGLERVDSYCMDPHKWLFTGMECDAFYVADRRPLIDALSVTPEYLRNPASESGAVIDYRDWHVPLGRRFRALRLWFVLRHYGAEGLRETVRAHVGWAQELAGWIDDGSPLRAGRARRRSTSSASATAAATRRPRRCSTRLNGVGPDVPHPTRVDGRYTVRMCIGGTATGAPPRGGRRGGHRSAAAASVSDPSRPGRSPAGCSWRRRCWVTRTSSGRSCSCSPTAPRARSASSSTGRRSPGPTSSSPAGASGWRRRP